MKKSGDKQDDKKLQLNAFKLRLSHFLHCVGRGQQEEAERLLNIPVQKNGNYENLLLAQETFTEYSLSLLLGDGTAY